ncbi:vascular endothelial growth factor receptor 2 [Orussus abietinus]|uniref:vascular endothelial growth factor receptor 2 n=1 Tax=Orussus abietinus TaxID=222816 RepID=UPI000626A271|nr:vascular endothelial growth factor receptor 2 [Orussus abietinus]
MFPRSIARRLIVATILFIFLLSVHGKKYLSVGVVRNLTVFSFEDRIHVKDENERGPLKLNISWARPIASKQPSSYSIVISSVTENTDNDIIECPEESLYYTTKNGSQLNALLPAHQLFSNLPEFFVRPSCSYKIQVRANPRINSTLQSTVIFKVPKCVGSYCNCLNAVKTLPEPKVHAVKNKEGKVLIKWSTISESPNVRFFVISVGVPLLVSKNGLPVYNTTRIIKTSSKVSSFTWTPRNDNSYLHTSQQYKIIVNAEDRFGCLGPTGTFLIQSNQSYLTAQYKLVWILILGMISVCAMTFCLLSFTWTQDRKRYELVWSSTWTKRYKCRLVDLILKHRNALYVEQEIEEAMARGEADDLEVSFRRLQLTQELGNGQFGRVCLGKLDGYEYPVAVKMPNSSDPTEPETRKQLLEEITMMKAAGPHPHLVRLIACCTLPNYPACVILEYMEGGDLFAYLRRLRGNVSEIDFHSYDISARSPSLTETTYTTLSNVSPSTPTSPTFSTCSFAQSTLDSAHLQYANIKDYEAMPDISPGNCRLKNDQVLRFALDIARGMEHLESKGITHRDLAARNILLDGNLTLKISDFGLSRNGEYTMDSGKGGIRRLPIRWMSPEALRDRAFSSRSDVWSFAVVLWEIGTLGAFPYPEIRDDQLLRYVLNSGRLSKPENLSVELYNVMNACWASRPEDRPNFAHLVPYLHSLHETSCP